MQESLARNVVQRTIFTVLATFLIPVVPEDCPTAHVRGSRRRTGKNGFNVSLIGYGVLHDDALLLSRSDVIESL
ncbi:hypothetical protein HYDPIDRAFT_113874 [Hydnomerulius pinastri MD-312]|uniref:Secreted protein n=1 Tax=Hydnomerulius pinastri MD-312 TaxID=994086 RepID=A0A0C9VX27_9AGAM|nr:hypothetical protein HYDPIDRAFT_113874 [Hydnomerulius pinastri MD-312]